MLMLMKGNRPFTRSRKTMLWLAAGAGAAALVLLAFFGAFDRAGPATRANQPAAIPVAVAAATAQDVPIFLDGLGTVQASNTIAIRTQINGTLQSVNFVEGQRVHKGDVLAVIDPRPLQAALDQAVAKKAEDEAMLVSAAKDLDRDKTLVQRSFQTQQVLDQQQAKVDQLKATIQADQALIENAQVQLSYATIMAPIDGMVGFRQVDAGNIVHTTDPNPLTVLTQLQPAWVIFTLPQSDLGVIREAMLRGTVTVLAFDQDNANELSDGRLLLIDNQIDQATSTIRLKATFDNKDDRLWPGEFVHIHIEAQTRTNAVTVPPAAVQRGPNGLFLWVVDANDTVIQRPIETLSVNNDITIVTHGLAAGERVVVNGQSRLEPGSRVAPKTATANAAATGVTNAGDAAR
jgi:membrane fusion protein, multidrug efflux system